MAAVLRRMARADFDLGTGHLARIPCVHGPLDTIHYGPLREAIAAEHECTGALAVPVRVIGPDLYKLKVGAERADRWADAADRHGDVVAGTIPLPLWGGRVNSRIAMISTSNVGYG